MQRRLTILSIIFAIGICLFALLKIPSVSSAVFKKVVTLKSRFLMHNNIVTGWSGWLFWEPELTYVTAALPKENVRRIIAFDRMLREQGITLFVVPIPNKIDIYPEIIGCNRLLHNKYENYFAYLVELYKSWPSNVNFHD